MEHSVEMQSGPGKAGSQPTKDNTETEVRVPAKIYLKSVLAGFKSSAKSKAAPPLNDITSSSHLAATTSTSATTTSQPTSPQKTGSLSITTTTTTLSSSSSSSSSTAITIAKTNTTTTSNTSTMAATETFPSLSSSKNDADDKKGTQNGDEDAKTEGEDEPFVMTPAYERLARLLARKREAAAAASASVVASGSREATTEVESDALPQPSHWSKLRTTVQIASVVKQRSKRRYHHNRQDSFLRKFSTRHNTNLDQDSDSEDNEAVTQEIEKEVEQKRLYRYVISPEGTFMMYWLLILTLAVLYNLWTCIAREAFREIQQEYTSFWISFDVACDIIYLGDILVHFRTGYLEQGLLVYDSKKLAQNYMTSTDFKFDVACLLPLDLLQLAIGWHPIVRFPRFMKIYRTFRCMYMLESRTPYPNLFRVANLTHILFLGAHWFAAFFYLISEAENFVGAWTYPKPVGEFAGVTRKYLYSLFWSTLTLTTIGDLPPPTTNWEKLLYDAETDVVILHFKTLGVPDLSPFRLKLETYLRLASIPYKVNDKRQLSSKGKIPWIEYNGEVVEDSQFCIKYLNEKFNVNIDKNLNREQVATARAFQVMVEENTFWCLVLSRWNYEKKQPIFDCLSLSRAIVWLIKRDQSKQAYSHGIGRHNWDEIKTITKKDLNALSDFLGKKPYLMGDEINEVDCSVFGLLAQFYWYQNGSYGQTLMHDCFPNLERYCERIKDKIWPDFTLLR